MRKLIIIFVAAISFNAGCQLNNNSIIYEYDEFMLPQPTGEIRIDMFDNIEVYEYDEFMLPEPRFRIENNNHQNYYPQNERIYRYDGDLFKPREINIGNPLF